MRTFALFLGPEMKRLIGKPSKSHAVALLLISLFTGTASAAPTVLADRAILSCPIKQGAVKNGTQPDPAVLQPMLQCRLGEKVASPGLDGAITIEISALKVGAQRPWDINLDMDGGVPGKTVVFPVKVTYSEKTFYRSGISVSANWIRIFNVFVNGFDEWQVGSIETIKMPDHSEIPNG